MVSFWDVLCKPSRRLCECERPRGWGVCKILRPARRCVQSHWNSLSSLKSSFPHLQDWLISYLSRRAIGAGLACRLSPQVCIVYSRLQLHLCGDLCRCIWVVSSLHEKDTPNLNSHVHWLFCSCYRLFAICLTLTWPKCDVEVMHVSIGNHSFSEHETGRVLTLG